MHPEQIKASLRMAGMTPAALADEMGVTRSTMSQVMNGRGTSARIQTRIAQIIGQPVAKLWPPKAGLVLRRAAPAKEPQTPERRAQDRRIQDRRAQDRRIHDRRVQDRPAGGAA